MVTAGWLWGPGEGATGKANTKGDSLGPVLLDVSAWPPWPWLIFFQVKLGSRLCWLKGVCGL